jgi:hypothetical protein
MGNSLKNGTDRYCYLLLFYFCKRSIEYLYGRSMERSYIATDRADMRSHVIRCALKTKRSPDYANTSGTVIAIAFGIEDDKRTRSNADIVVYFEVIESF